MKLILSGVVAAAAGTVYFIVMLFSGSGSLYQIIGFSMAMSNTVSYFPHESSSTLILTYHNISIAVRRAAYYRFDG